MNTQLASKMGEAFCLGVLYARRKKLAFDEAKWITVKPNGPQHTGRPALIDSATGEVLGGMGGKFNGRHISAVKQGGKFEQPGAQMQIIARNSAQKAAAMNNQRIDFKSVGAQTTKSEAQNANSLEVKKQEQAVEQEKAKTAKNFVENKGWAKASSGYYNPTNKQFADMIGLELEYYKTGNIKSAVLNGEYISNASARRLLGAKDNTYLDANGILHVPDDIKNKIKPEYKSLILTPEQTETRKKANPNFRPLGSPVSVKNETDRAVLIEGKTGTYWMPKSQVVRENGLVTWVNKDLAQEKIQNNQSAISSKKPSESIANADYKKYHMPLNQLAKIERETDKAFLVNSDFSSRFDGDDTVFRNKAVWVPKSQVSSKNGYVFGMNPHWAKENGFQTLSSRELAEKRWSFPQNETSTKQASKENVSASGVLGIPNASNWNRKIYTYKNGEKAVFINNKKIILNDEQYNKLKSLT